MTKAASKRKGAKARLMWAVREKGGTTCHLAKDTTDADIYRALGFDADAPVSISPVFILDADPESIEAMREQVARALFRYLKRMAYSRGQGWANQTQPEQDYFRNMAGCALAEISLTSDPTKTGRK